MRSLFTQSLQNRILNDIKDQVISMASAGFNKSIFLMLFVPKNPIILNDCCNNERCTKVLNLNEVKNMMPNYLMSHMANICMALLLNLHTSQ